MPRTASICSSSPMVGRSLWESPSRSHHLTPAPLWSTLPVGRAIIPYLLPTMSNPADIWAGLTRPSGGLTARLHPESSGVWLAVDSDGRRHLLVRATTAEPSRALMVTRGLRAMISVLSVEQEPEDVWVDIACLDPTLNDTFVAVADNLAEEVRVNPNDPIDAVQMTLRRWQWFWGIAPTSLSDEKALGLFGELWFI